MRIGIPKEIKAKEARVSCTPDGVRTLVDAGHQVLVEAGAGVGSGFEDRRYQGAGASIVDEAKVAWDADMVVKVKEPIESEYGFFREGLLLFTYLHLAANKPLTERLCEAKVTGIAYETVDVGGHLPLLEPMSIVAGRIGSLMGAYYLSKPRGGKGTLLGTIPGVPPGNVLVLGGGSAGLNAALVASGMGADVTVLEISEERMRSIEESTNGAVGTLLSTEESLLERLPHTDVLVGAVLIPGARAPKLIKREALQRMSPGSVFVDIAIDQGGCAETSRPTTHDDPVYVEENVLHYCVTNMPALYPRTSTQALTHATLPYATHLATGLEDALRKAPELRGGVNTRGGKITHPAVAEAHGLAFAE